MLLAGQEEGIPYSLSRWTDLPAAKWPWFKEQLNQGWMWAVDPRSGVPCRWSLAPEDTRALVFWTRDPRNLILDRVLLTPYQVQVHLTVTGWGEVEHKAPTLREGVGLLRDVSAVYGPSSIVWRFSPVPVVEDVVDRFERILEAAVGLVSKVYIAFLQTNDRMGDPRSIEERVSILTQLSQKGQAAGIEVLLCNEDAGLITGRKVSSCVKTGVCVSTLGLTSPGKKDPITEGCGCVLMADPFTINESCIFGCEFCYAADQTLSPKKRNTARHLPMVRL